MILRLAAEMENLVSAIDRASNIATMGLLLFTCWFATWLLRLVWPTLRWAALTCFNSFKKAPNNAKLGPQLHDPSPDTLKPQYP